MNKAFNSKLLIYLAISIILSYIYLLNRTRDWDHFLTTFTLDGLGFMENLKPIKWSYLLCGGVTRLGDPQSFSYSPFLIFPILFGGFWGTKFFTIFSFFIGLVYSVKTLELLNPENSKKILFPLAIALPFVYSNYFLSHITEGHLTFLLIFFAIGILFYSFQIFLSSKFQPIDILLLALFVYLTFSGGFYAVAMYFAIPIILSFALTLLLSVKYLKKSLPQLVYISSGLLLGAIPSLPKMLGVLQYQSLYPRTLKPLVESSNVIENLSYYLLPTYNYLYLGIIKSNSYWGTWEKTAFSFLIPLFFIGIFFVIKNKSYNAHLDKKLLIIRRFSVTLLIVGILLSIGDFASYSPFSILKSLFNNSVRVPFRFSIISLFAIFLILSFLPLKKYLNETSLYLIILLTALNTISFYKPHFFEYPRISSFPDKLGHYTELTFVPRRNNIASFMLNASELGIGVYNCYMPLSREIRLADEFSFPNSYTIKNFHFIQGDDISNSCRERSFFSQEEIKIDSSCPDNICFNLNGFNFYTEQSKNYQYNENVPGFCTSR